VRVPRQFYRVNGTMTVDTPKSERGFRSVAIPDFVAAHLASHLSHYGPDVSADSLVFVTSGGRVVLDSYSQVTRRALQRMGRPDVRAHDLRHSAMTAAAEHGATLATLMQMAGHSTPDAALRYQHATMEHSRWVANALDASASRILGTE
jgi:integrase